MTAFSFDTVPHLEVEPGCSRRMGVVCTALLPVGAAPGIALIVTDTYLAKSGLLDGMRRSLQDAGWHVAEYAGVEPDPSERVIHDAVVMARVERTSLVVGFGGGSSMDVAKVVACLAAPHTTLQLSDLYGVESIRTTRLPLVMVPTTAGTGSEVTRIAIVTTGDSAKVGIVNRALMADVVLLDALLTLGLPPSVTAATGIDAIVHAIEAYTSATRKNPFSDMLARQALALLCGNLMLSYSDGQNVSARQSMMVGAMMAGQAFENAPVAAVHALAYPLGGIYHVAHGVSNALVLPHVMRFNRSACSVLYAELADVILPGLSGNPLQRCDALIDYMVDLCDKTGLPTRLRDCQIEHRAIAELAAAAMGQQRLLKNNPRPVTLEDAQAIYQAAW